MTICLIIHVVHAIFAFQLLDTSDVNYANQRNGVSIFVFFCLLCNLSLTIYMLYSSLTVGFATANQRGAERAALHQMRRGALRVQQLHAEKWGPRRAPSAKQGHQSCSGDGHCGRLLAFDARRPPSSMTYILFLFVVIANSIFQRLYIFACNCSLLHGISSLIYPSPSPFLHPRNQNIPSP